MALDEISGISLVRV